MLNIECQPKGYRSIEVLIDGEPWREIHFSLFGKRPMLPKNCLSIEEFAREFAVIELRQAKAYALKRLSIANLASCRLLQDFRRLLVSEETALRVIEDLKQAGYINDSDFAESFVRRQSARKLGPRAIASKLARHGFTSEETGAAIENCQSEEQQQEAIAALLASRYRSRNLSDSRERNKVIAALARRGFELNVILDCIRGGD